MASHPCTCSCLTCSPRQRPSLAPPQPWDCQTRTTSLFMTGRASLPRLEHGGAHNEPMIIHWSIVLDSSVVFGSATFCAGKRGLFATTPPVSPMLYHPAQAIQRGFGTPLLYSCCMCTFSQYVVLPAGWAPPGKHLYRMYSYTICTPVLHVYLYCMYTSTVCIPVLYVYLFRMYTCTVCTPSCRMFRVFGHDAVSVLEGGLPLWQSLGLPAETAPSEDAEARHRASLEAVAEAYSGKGGSNAGGFKASLRPELVLGQKEVGRGTLVCVLFCERTDFLTRLGAFHVRKKHPRQCCHR